MTIKLLDAHEAADYPGLVGESVGVQIGVVVDRIGEPRVSRVMRGPMKQPTKAALREQLVLAAAENRRLSRSLEIAEACADFWQEEARLTTWRRLLRWIRRHSRL